MMGSHLDGECFIKFKLIGAIAPARCVLSFQCLSSLAAMSVHMMKHDNIVDRHAKYDNIMTTSEDGAAANSMSSIPA
jgi:hypothetical protein